MQKKYFHKVTIGVSAAITLAVIGILIASLLTQTVHSNAVATINKIHDLRYSQEYDDFIDEFSKINSKNDAEMAEFLEENDEFVDEVMEVVSLGDENVGDGSNFNKKLVLFKEFHDFSNVLETPEGSNLDIVDDGITTRDGISYFSLSSVLVVDENGKTLNQIKGTSKPFYLINDGKTIVLGEFPQK